MATYMSGLSDNIQETRTQGESYQFLQQLQPYMDRANQQYESGLSDVMSGYGNIVNAPVTGIQAQETKKKYVQDAQNKLRTLSAQDLSLPQNVLQAETAYAPFWKDDALLMNVGHTRAAAKVDNVYNSWRDSNDKEIRDQYSEYGTADVQRFREQLANAPMTVDAYRKLEAPTAVRGANIDADIAAMWEQEYGKGADKGVATVTTQGLAMRTEFNGPKSLDAYRTYALSKIGNNYDEFLKMKSRVEVWRTAKEIKATNPEMTEQQVNETLAEKRMDYLREKTLHSAESYSKMAEYHTGMLNSINDQVKKYQKGNLTDADRMNMQYHIEKAAMFNKGYNDYNTLAQTRYSPTVRGLRNDAYYKELGDIATNPTGYMANLEKMTIADQWAIGKASISQEKIEVNPIQKEMIRMAEEDRKFKLDVRKQGLEEQKERNTQERAILDYIQGTGVDPRTQRRVEGYDDMFLFKHGNALGDVVGGVGSPQAIAKGAQSGSTGQSTVEAVKVPDMYKVIQDNITGQKMQFLNSVADVGVRNGVAGYGNIVLGEDGVGLSMGEMGDFTNYMQEMKGGLNTGTPEQRAAWGKVKDNVTKALSSQGIKVNITGPFSMAGALQQYGNRIVGPGLRDASGNTDKEKKLLALSTQASDIQTIQQRYTKAQETLDKEVQSKILTAPQYQSLTYTDNNGQKKMVDENYIGKIVPTVKAIDKSTGKKITLSNKEIAEAYSNGTYDLKQTGLKNSDVMDWNESAVEITIGDKKYDIIADDVNDAIRLRDATGKLERIHGSSDNLYKRKQAAGQEVAKGLGVAQDGIIFKTQKFDMEAAKMGDKVEEQFAHNYLNEASNPANTSTMYDYNIGNATKESIEKQESIKAIRNAMGSVAGREKNVAGFEVKVNDAMEPVVAVTFKADATDVGDYKGKTVHMRISPNAQGRYMNSISSPILNEPWGGLYTGEKFMNNSLQEQTGFTYNAVPINKGADGKYHDANVEYTMLVPTGNKFIEQTIRMTVPLSGDQKKMASEIDTHIRNKYVTHVANTLAKKQLENKIASQPR